MTPVTESVPSSLTVTDSFLGLTSRGLMSVSLTLLGTVLIMRSNMVLHVSRKKSFDVAICEIMPPPSAWKMRKSDRVGSF